ncbi:MAG: ATP-binding cassette domain-containing protein [Sulfolobales archaeon]
MREEILSLIEISKRVGSEVVLSRFSLTLESGDVVIVRGRSGVGKTTLAKIASLQMRPDEGVVRFIGRDIRGLRESLLSELRLRYVGYIDQEFRLLSRLTVYENIELPLALLRVPKNIRRRLIDEILERLEISRHRDKYPHELSGGERQRVAIARAVVKRPRLLVADEPFSNLDNVTISRVVDLFRELLREQGVAILLTTTDLISDYGFGRNIYLSR